MPHSALPSNLTQIKTVGLNVGLNSVCIWMKIFIFRCVGKKKESLKKQMKKNALRYKQGWSALMNCSITRRSLWVLLKKHAKRFRDCAQSFLTAIWLQQLIQKAARGKSPKVQRFSSHKYPALSIPIWTIFQSNHVTLGVCKTGLEVSQEQIFSRDLQYFFPY